MTLSVRVRKRMTPSFALDVQFSALPGVTILFGASGSGKTTILRCVAGLLRPDAGRIVIDDSAVFDSGTGTDVPPGKRGFGFVFQDLALFPHLTAEQNIGYGLFARAPEERRERVSRIAAAFHLEEVLHRPPGEISGGQRQRVGLARSLVTDPRALLLDEPLSALDHHTQSRIIEDLRLWTAARRIPVLYVTHSQREVFALGDRVIALHDGAIAADGAPEAVMNAPETEAMASLAGFENVFDALVVQRLESAGVMRSRIAGTQVDLEVPLGIAMEGSTIRIAIRAGDILLATEPPRGLSARNVMPGRIVALVTERSQVKLTVDVGIGIHAAVTPTARETLGLRLGEAVWVIIKTHSCRVVSTL
ncbi:MAG TPA: molybdenum ABC transporter ATP-binding protein [Vicinamibacterales bacterium]